MERYDSRQLRSPLRRQTPRFRRESSPYFYGEKGFDGPKGRIRDANASTSATYGFDDRSRPCETRQCKTDCDKTTCSKRETSRTGESPITDKSCGSPHFAMKMFGNSASFETREGAENEEPRRKDKFVARMRESMPKVLTGTANKVADWLKLGNNNCHIFIEVISYVVDVKPGKWPSQKCIVLRDEKNAPSLRVVFHEIDRALPTLTAGEVVKCIGKPVSGNCIQAFKVEASSEEEKNASQRLFFISNMSAKEASASSVGKYR